MSSEDAKRPAEHVKTATEKNVEKFISSHPSCHRVSIAPSADGLLIFRIRKERPRRITVSELHSTEDAFRNGELHILEGMWKKLEDYEREYYGH